MVPVVTLKCKRRAPILTAFATAIALLGWGQDTGRLSQELESHGPGTREAGWGDRLASIVVTRQTVYIHKN